ncbi:unnamed protein product [Caenorhabditis angaria]|uniref:Serpentine receptor class gamma n=1 Tax=Caenorhabditis angaria TaxID=860376 RepID=A0A9P1IEW3_9PELO|nr:unnamed protein product [Caenorhabditis angaria]
MKTRPEKCILLQTFLILFIKSATIMIIIGLRLDWDMINVYYVVIDTLTTPFIIQISYLFCNKSNLETIRNILKCRRFRRIGVVYQENAIESTRNV